MAGMSIPGALVERSGEVGLEAWKKALYPDLDMRYHSMIPVNQQAKDTGAEFVRNSQRL